MSDKKLYRIQEGKMIAGICKGVGVYFNVDPTIIRLLWVLFACLGGSGILAYLIAWIIVPVVPEIGPSHIHYDDTSY